MSTSDLIERMREKWKTASENSLLINQAANELERLTAERREAGEVGADKDQQARDYVAGLAKGIRSMGADKTGEGS